MKVLTVKLPDRVFFEIDEEAKARRISKSDVVREGLSRRHPSRTGSGDSLWSRMKDLVIVSDRLPRDLSTNKGYMKGYGKTRSSPPCVVFTTDSHFEIYRKHGRQVIPLINP